jgi:DNA-binding NtrC family response regulator
MRILIVDDVQEYLNAMSRALRGYEVVQATTLSEAKEKLDASIDVVLADVRLSENDPANRDGIRLLKWAKEEHPSVPVVVMSAYRDHDAAVDAVNLGAERYLKKPINLRTLNDLISELQASEA